MSFLKSEMEKFTPLQILNFYWKYPAFREMQEDIINASLQGKDVLAILPTGGGKSVCYQVAGLARKKLTLVISPLIALMKDQVEQLNRRNIRATFINSSLSKREIENRLFEVRAGKYDFLYCAPERLTTNSLLETLPYLNIGLLAIDEAHCISQWGHQFRPSYRKIAEFRKKIPEVPVMAVTASATPEVRKDIIEQLAMKNPAIFVKTFVRENLRYSVMYETDLEKKMLQILRNVPGTSIVYVRSRKATQEYASFLRKYGFSAEAYHAGLSTEKRNRIQEKWIRNEIRIIVATNAFGMGIDKPDVRSVIHIDLPPDLESYYQEAGRAGRDGKTAYPVILFHPSFPDKMIKKWENAYPDYKTVKEVYDMLCNLYYVSKNNFPKTPFVIDLERWGKILKIPYSQITASMKILEDAELLYLLDDRDKHKASLRFIASPKKMRKFAQKNENVAKVLEILTRETNGSVFSSMEELDLRRTAWKYKISETLLKETLDFLANLSYLEYVPPLERSGFRFLQPRRKLSKKLLNWELQEFLKEQAKQRLFAMIDYAEGIEVCRSQYIARYFGELDAKPCKKCDVCIGRHKRKPSTDVARSLKRILKQRKSLPIRELLEHFPPAQKEKVVAHIRRMLAEGELQKKNFDEISLK